MNLMENRALRSGRPQKEVGLEEKIAGYTAELEQIEATITAGEANGEVQKARKILSGMVTVKGALAELPGADVSLQHAVALEQSLRDWVAQHTVDEELLARRRTLKQSIEQARLDLQN